jgi:hypothetical protein
MVDDMEYLHNNETCDSVELPNGWKLVHRMWVFKKKLNATDQVEKYKA